MSIWSAIGDFFGSEADHLGQLTNSALKNPLQDLLGAADPVGAKVWSGLTGFNFTPQVNVFGGETNTQYRTSQDRGYNTTYSRDLGYVADAIAVYEAGDYAYDAAGLGGAAAATGGAAGGAGAGAGAGTGTAMGGAAGTLGAADSAGASAQLGLTAADVGGTSGATAGAGTAAGSGAGAGSSGWMDFAKGAAKAVAPAVINSLLQPKPPKAAAPIAMPDPLAQQQAQQQKIIQQLARRGRASTILTSPGNSGGSLGG